MDSCEFRGRELAKISKALDVSYPELAKALPGYTCEAVKKWVNRDSVIPQSATTKLCAFFNERIEERERKHKIIRQSMLIICAQSVPEQGQKRRLH